MDDQALPPRACTTCGIAKPCTNEFFAKQKTGRHGLASKCKECSKATTIAWRLANPGRAAEMTKRYRIENAEKVRAADRHRNAKRVEYQREKVKEWKLLNPARVRELRIRWQSEKRDAIRQHKRLYHLANRDRFSTYIRKWRKDNPEKLRIYSQNRRARARASGAGLSVGIVAKLMKLQRGRCACCGVKLAKYHLDHIVPLALGGRHEDANMQLLTPTCNSRKGAKRPEDYARERGLLI